ncbi:MAG: histidine phosphatase family protein [Anaerolineae bacterium]|nr:histidine phosphatase family protein [Anaerolineae bacterium]
MELLLIRHGESTWNAEGIIQGWGDPPLSEAARAQARSLGLRLSQQEGITALYSSTLQRARETAEIIGELTGTSPHFDDRLREGGIGVLTGVNVKEVEKLYPEIWRDWQESPLQTPIPGGEDNENFRKRVTQVMESILANHEDNDQIAVVSHGGTFGIYLAHLIDLDMRKRVPFRFANASLSMIQLGGVRPRIALLNDTCHLERS